MRPSSAPTPSDPVTKGDVLTLADRGTHLLLKPPYEDLPTYVDDVIFRLQLQGITPVPAPVERYTSVRSDWNILDRTRGADLAHDLMDPGEVACMATDAHDAVNRCPRSIWNEWGTSFPEGEQL